MDQPDITRCAPDDPRLDEVLALIRASFAYMEGRVDPPSSMTRLTREAVAGHCVAGEVWATDPPVTACAFFSEKGGRLYIGKLAVDRAARGRGLARALVDLAGIRARALGLPELELQTRIELTENHAAFARLGFVKTGETAHPGYGRPTSITMRRPVGPGPGGRGREPVTGRRRDRT